jgi:hypothetical protein
MALPDDTGSDPADRPRRVGLVAGLLVTVLAAALAVAFGLARVDDPGEIVLGVVALHDQGATGPPPPSIPETGPRDSFADFASRAGWVPSGVREDRVEGRSTATVFWDRAGRRIAYTRVSGGPVDAPGESRRIGRRGVLLRSFGVAGRTGVTWNENGHTAVISAIGISRAALYNLAGGPPPTR